jgi:hypothetical protein
MLQRCWNGVMMCYARLCCVPCRSQGSGAAAMVSLPQRQYLRRYLGVTGHYRGVTSCEMLSRYCRMLSLCCVFASRWWRERGLTCGR